MKKVSRLAIISACLSALSACTTLPQAANFQAIQGLHPWDISDRYTVRNVPVPTDAQFAAMQRAVSRAHHIRKSAGPYEQPDYQYLGLRDREGAVWHVVTGFFPEVGHHVIVGVFDDRLNLRAHWVTGARSASWDPRARH